MSGTRSTRSSANSSSSSSEDEPPPPPPPTRVVVSPIKGNSPNPRVVMEKVKEECLIEKKVDKVDKVSVAIKHPGVFMETAELEKETGQKLKVGISQEEKKEKKDSEPEKEEEKTEKDGEPTKMDEEPSEEQMEQVDDSQQKEEAASEENISTGTPEPKPAEDKEEGEATLDGNPVKMEIEEAEIEISQPASKVLTRRSRRTGAATAVDEDVKKEEDQGVSSESSSGVRLPLELPTGEDSEGEDVSCANSGPTVAKEDNDSVGSSSTQTTTRSSTRRRAGGDESAADSVLSSSASLSRRAKTGLKGGHVGANPKGPKGRRSIFKKSVSKIGFNITIKMLCIY